VKECLQPAAKTAIALLARKMLVKKIAKRLQNPVVAAAQEVTS